MKQYATNEPTYLFATIGALTERGGRVTTARGGTTIQGLGMACVGDVVTYPDGSEAVIRDGAGSALVIDGRPAALVGSSLSNGDRIIETLVMCCGIVVRAGETIEGLFDASYVPPPHPGPTYRFAVSGATTRLGGVLRAATSEYEIREIQRNAARVGDFVEYADGTRAQIVTGVGLPDAPGLRPLAVVGSLLDNDDVISDSPDRLDHSVSFVPVRADIAVH